MASSNKEKRKLRAELVEIRNLLKQHQRRVTQMEKTIQQTMIIISILSQKGLISDEEIKEEFAILTDKNKNPEKTERKYLGPEKRVNGGEPDNKSGTQVSDDKNPRVINASEQFKRKETNTGPNESDN